MLLWSSNLVLLPGLVMTEQVEELLPLRRADGAVCGGEQPPIFLVLS